MTKFNLVVALYLYLPIRLLLQLGYSWVTALIERWENAWTSKRMEAVVWNRNSLICKKERR